MRASSRGAGVCIVQQCKREYIPYFIPAAAARTGFDREEMKGRSCLARLDHPSSLSHRIGKRKAAEAIYLLSHRGGGGREGRRRRRRRVRKKGGREKRKKKLLILKSSPSTVILTFFPLFHLIISAQNGGLLPSALSTE